ncbi:hypothetical protein [Aporhodopirellula aestuarii]|uniref:Uncharacterized protein n=1 Tax=Aporhodopirellula aestuarii TaxID=2950107 RepID=A0ABT0U5D4_9BACT|nr:hypothetical protein [Aporhodopirellula aestuarii]MCM2371561.1 hypothetical protein [Aporhodopirellula aestuarii]
MPAQVPKQIRPQLGAAKPSVGAGCFIGAIVLINVIGITMAKLLPWLNQYLQ